MSDSDRELPDTLPDQPEEDEAPDFFDFLPLPLILLNTLIFSLLFEETSEDESEDDFFENDPTMFNGRRYSTHPWQIVIKQEMLKPIKGGSLFDLSYSPVVNKYSVNGELSDKCFHFSSNNVDLHNDFSGNFYLSRPQFATFSGNCSIEWTFDFTELHKTIVCAKAVLKSELLKDDSSITWSILVGNQRKWKTLRSENRKSLFDHPISLTEFLSHEKKFHLKVEMNGRGKRSLPGIGSTKLFEAQNVDSSFFQMKIWLADDSITTPIGGSVIDHSRLINQAQGSDLTLISGDRTIHAHKGILSDRSDYFKAMLSSGMEEAQKGQISFPDIDSRVLLQVLKFLYSAGNIPDKLLFRFGQKHVNGKKAERVDVTDLLLLAGRFNIVPLIQRCEKRLIPYVDLASANDLLALAIDTGANQLKAFCEVFIDANQEEIKRLEENRETNPPEPEGEEPCPEADRELDSAGGDDELEPEKDELPAERQKGKEKQRLIERPEGKRLKEKARARTREPEEQVCEEAGGPWRPRMEGEQEQEQIGEKRRGGEGEPAGHEGHGLAGPSKKRRCGQA